MVILKDVNFIESNDLFIQMEMKTREELFEQVKKDTEFFTKLHIMDYSLLIGVNDSINPQNRLTRTESSSSCSLAYRKIAFGDKIYSVSIIDILQKYDCWKRMEFSYKATFRTADPSELSCVDPEYYRQRFLGFFNSIMVGVNVNPE